MTDICKKSCLLFLIASFIGSYFFCTSTPYQEIVLNYGGSQNNSNNRNDNHAAHSNGFGVNTGGNFNSYNHTNFANVSPYDFNDVFKNVPEECQVLCQLELFTYQNFRIYARTLPCYEDFMLQLHSKIKNNKNFMVHGFKHKISWGKVKSEFHNFVRDEADRITNEIITRKIHEQAEANQKKQNVERAAEIKKQQEKKPRLCVTNNAALNELGTFYTKLQNNAEEKMANRHTQRSEAVKKTIACNGACADYSSQIPTLSANDIYAEVFENTYGTPLDCQLHIELCQTRNSMTQLEYDFPKSHHIQSIAPMVHHLAAQAKIELQPTAAFELSDFCHALTQVVDKGVHALSDLSGAAGRRVSNGTKTWFTPEHWVQAVTGCLQLGALFVNSVGQADINQEAFLAASFSKNPEAISKYAQAYCLHTQAQNDVINLFAQETRKKIETTSWRELGGNAIELGTTMILDVVTLNVIGGFAGASGRALIDLLSNPIGREAFFTEQYAVEVAGFGKLIIEEGHEAATKAVTVITQDAALIKASTQESMAQTIKNNLSKAIGEHCEEICNVWQAKDFAAESLQKHFKKHVIDKAEWGIESNLTVDQYLHKAKNLLNSQTTENIEGFISKNGFVFRYNKITNEFATAKPNGTIETLFRPKQGIAYWEEQLKAFKH